MKRAPLLFLALCVILSTLTSVRGQAMSDEKVGEMIAELTKYLLAEQGNAGDWEGSNSKKAGDRHWTGESSLVLYSLLASGRSAQEPTIAKAVRWLQGEEAIGIYATGVRCHVWSNLPADFIPNLQKDATYLINGHYKGTFDYFPPNDKERAGKEKVRIDHSATQYGVLGLWELVKRVGSFSGGFWEMERDHWMGVQNNDGGWGYMPGNKSTGSMTAAGVTVLYIVQQELYADSPVPNAQLQASINAGLKWLDQNFEGDENPGREKKDLYYYLYGIERVALAGGIKRFNGEDWFVAGAKYIEETQQKDGSVRSDHGGENVSAAFALLFLSRGRVPVWVNKIALPNAAWNNRPNDIYFLSRYLSDMREHELNWQVVSVDDPASDWLNAPIAYISTGDPLNLDATQVANIQEYIERGGLLYINPEGSASATLNDARNLAQQMYPNLELKAMERDHPVANLITDMSARGAPPLLVLNNGVRDLMIVSQADWGFDFQANIRYGQPGNWSYMLNLQTLTSDRDKLPNRLADPIERKKESVKSRGSFKLVRATHTGNDGVEPMLFDNAKGALYNRTGYDLEAQKEPLEDIGGSDASLVYLTGVDPITLTQPQIDAIKAYVDGGGTVLIDTLGGRGKFVGSIEQQLSNVLGMPTRLDPSNPMVSGSGLGNNDTSLDAAAWRPFTSGGEVDFGDQFRLRAIHIDGRPAIILSSEDIGMGVMGIRRFGVNGYSINTARALFANIMAATKNE